MCLLSFTCNYVVSVWRSFLFLLVLGMGCVILLWQTLGLPYNYFIEYLWHLMKCQNVIFTIELRLQDETYKTVKCDNNTRMKIKKPNPLHDSLHGVDLTIYK